MSFFADIIADSRRKIVPIHRPDPISGPMPVQVNSSQPVVSETMQDRTIGNDEGYENATVIASPDTILPAVSSPSKTSTTRTSAPFASRIAETEGHVLKGPGSSAPVLASNTSRLNAAVVPTVQLKAEHKTQSSSVSQKVVGPVSDNVTVNTGRKEMSTETSTPDAVRSGTKQIDLKQEQFVEKPVTSPATSLFEQHALKQDGMMQAPSLKAKLPPDEIIDQSGMTPEVVGTGTVTSTQSRQEDHQQSAEASAPSVVTAAIQIESPATRVRQVNAPVASIGHSNDVNNQQSRVQIGQVNVVIEQPAAPRKRASAVTGNDDFASRNFLKSL